MSTETMNYSLTWLAMGIDPGLSGGVAVLGRRGDQEVVAVHKMPVRKTGKANKETVDTSTLYHLIKSYVCPGVRPLLAVEKVSAMRKEGRTQGVTSTFTFGQGYGKVLAVVELLVADGLLAVVEPMPQTWQKLILKGRSGGKEASIAYCLARYPDVSLKPTPRSRTDNHGLADALCLAEYALRQRVRHLEGTADE